MKVRQLECLTAVAATGSLKGAGATLRLTQPAVSYQLRELESELGVGLLAHRLGRLVLTSTGRAFVCHAALVLQAVGDARTAVQQFSNGAPEILRVGLAPEAEQLLQPGRLKRFHAAWPTVHISINNFDVEELMASLIIRRLDVTVLPNHRLAQLPFFLPDSMAVFLFPALGSHHSLADDGWLPIGRAHRPAGVGEQENTLLLIAPRPIVAQPLFVDLFEELNRGVALTRFADTRVIASG